MLVIPDVARFVRKPRPIETKTPPGPPVLVSATYAAGESVTLAFDRAIDLGEVRVDLMIVNDPTDTASRYSGADAYAEGERAVRVTLSNDGDASGDGLWLTAPATVAIRAAEGGMAWAGVVKLALPFG